MPTNSYLVVYHVSDFYSPDHNYYSPINQYKMPHEPLLKMLRHIDVLPKEGHHKYLS